MRPAPSRPWTPAPGPGTPAPPRRASPSGRCPALSRRTPHSWRGRARTEDQRKEKAQYSSGRELGGHPEEAEEALRPGPGTREKGSGSRGKTELARREPAATSDGKRRAGRGGKGVQEGREGEAGADWGLCSRGGAQRRPSITPFPLAHWLDPRRLPNLPLFLPLARRGRAVPLAESGSPRGGLPPWLGAEAVARWPPRAGAGACLRRGGSCPVRYSRRPAGALPPPLDFGPGQRAAAPGPADPELTPCDLTLAAAQPPAHLRRA